jgi:hypothetical protein
MALTSETRQELTYWVERGDDLKFPAGHPVEGYPVVWPEPGDSLVLEPARSASRVAPELVEHRTGTISFTVHSPLLDAVETDNPPRRPQMTPASFRMKGFFRGESFELLTPIDLHPLAERVRNRHEPSSRASLAVRATEEVARSFGESDGTVAIVLDCSGSMGSFDANGQPIPPQAGSKYREAVGALGQVLQKVAQGTRVSLWIFGSQFREGRPGPVSEEESIYQLQAPVVWNPARLDELMRKLSTIWPYHHTPLVRTMLMTKADFQDVKGFKTLLVLTDGQDDRYQEGQEEGVRKARIEQALREAFVPLGVQVNVIVFKEAQQQQALKQATFKDVIQDLPGRGRFVTVQEAEQLAAVLEAALKRTLRYEVESENNAPLDLGVRREFVVSRSRGDDQWYAPALPPRVFNVVVHANGRVDKKFQLDSGDRLLLQLATTPAGGLALDRAVFSAEDYPRRPSRQQQGWRLAVLQNQLKGTDGLEMLATLEELPVRGESILRQRKPEVWMEVQPASGLNAPFALRWGNRGGYPAPAWGFNVPEWTRDPETQGPARPILRAWWNPSTEPPRAARLVKPTDFQDPLLEAPAGLGKRVVDVAGGDQIRIESVRVEDHRVEVAPGQYATRPCLVVRLRHPPGKPVWVRPRGGIDPPGVEDRFYAQANKYTGLFWPVNEDEVKKGLHSLDLFALEDFKREAEARGCLITIDDLKPPDPGDRRPVPIDLDPESARVDGRVPTAPAASQPR